MLSLSGIVWFFLCETRSANVNLIWLIWPPLQNGLSSLPRQRVSLPLIDVPVNSIFHCQRLKLPERDEVPVGNKDPGAT